MFFTALSYNKSLCTFAPRGIFISHLRSRFDWQVNFDSVNYAFILTSAWKRMKRDKESKQKREKCSIKHFSFPTHFFQHEIFSRKKHVYFSILTPKWKFYLLSFYFFYLLNLKLFLSQKFFKSLMVSWEKRLSHCNKQLLLMKNLLTLLLYRF